MKTLINSAQKMKREITGIMLIASSLWFAGCEKAELPQPASSPASNSFDRLAADFSNHVMLVIEHNAVRSNLPDYIVTLRRNGAVEFEGRKNVSHIGRYKMQAEEGTVSYIKNMFEAANFFNIQQVPIQWDAPNVATTYSNGIRSKTLIDFNKGIPQLLIQIRKKAEEKLNISRYIYGDVPAPSAPVSL